MPANRQPIWIVTCIAGASLLVGAVTSVAEDFLEKINPLVEASCIDCHDDDTKTRLNFDALGEDLSDPATFRQWVKVFDRTTQGEMPPDKKARPDPGIAQPALASLERHLLAADRAAQKAQGRVPSRRLTRLEFGYTIRDLFGIEDDLADLLPAETESGGFDNLGSHQRTSALHITSYLAAADRALDAVDRLRAQPESSRTLVDYQNSPQVDWLISKPLKQGGSNLKKLDDAVVMFLDLDYVLRSDKNGLTIKAPGQYRITIEAYAYQSDHPMTMKLIQANPQRGDAHMLGAFELPPGKPRDIEVTAFLQPGDHVYPTVHVTKLNTWNGLTAAGGAQNYTGEGIAIRPLHVEGPLSETEAPPVARAVLNDPKSIGTRATPANVEAAIAKIAPLAFRRPVLPSEIESFAALSENAVEEGSNITNALRVPLRSILSSPQFLFFEYKPGKLSDYALANRLSYFLWKSMPDETLFNLAKEGRLSDPDTLSAQVEWMLKDEKSMRFIKDFAGQWLRLYDLNATMPDRRLYPEFDGLLNHSIQKESELFLNALVQENLSARHLIDSDFTFVNRRLADHYQLPGVVGQEMRKVSLPANSPRGGIIAQASVHKLTANGTFTSPVKRGAYILTHLLGEAPEPPPPNVGSIEPDTRGATTIRETLEKHRNMESCAQCHRSIDPPGFALESFDPIGGFRGHYRAGSTEGERRPYRRGLKVDASGVTPDGETFANFWEYKQLLMEKEDQIAHHFISQLITYATGAEIQFADREEVARIAEEVRARNYPVRAILHEIVQSPLFTHQ
jgi:mono/diheme cytochrome c family protein